MDGIDKSRKILILYGSQTGCAEEVAEGLARDAFRHHFNVHLSPLDDFEIKDLLSSPLALFACSTTGQGDLPSNMKRFWRFIMRRNLPADSLNHLRFAVIGLGDSSYPNYNFVAKKLFRRLQQLSGVPLGPVILGDDQHQLGLDAALDEHVPRLWQNINMLFSLPPLIPSISPTELLPPKYRITANSSSSLCQPIENNHSTHVTSSSTPFPARLISNARITSSSHFQDVRLIQLDITNSNIKYEPGDVAYIRPQNSKDKVDTFLSLLSLDGDQQISIEPYAGKGTIPSRLKSLYTWKDLATSYLDLSAIPRRYFFELLSHFTKDELEREKLQEFASPEGQDERFAYCNRVRRSILEVLSEFRHSTPNIPTDYILDLIPALQPRAFSIASAQSTDSDVIELLVAVVKYKTKLSTPRLGVCSNWLANLDPVSNGYDDIPPSMSPPVPLWTQKGTLKFPAQGEPCIMIGPGTGVAPFRSFIQHRIFEGHHRNLLIFGNRNKDGDFLCGNEWQSLTSSGKLTLLTAFSRDQDEKYYVWNSMKDNTDLIWKWLYEDNAYVFIAGNAKRMPDDIRACFVNIVKAKLDLSTEDAEEYMRQLDNAGRYQLECW